MKNKNLLLIGSLVTASVITVSLINPLTTTESSVYEPRKQENKAKTGGEAAMEFYRSQNVNPETGLYDEEYLRQMRENMLAYNSMQSRINTLSWTEEGPDNVGGRTRAICIDRNDANHVFAGSVSGGLFVSNNGGNNWTLVTGFNEYLRISTMCQTLNGTYYVGTGSSFDNWSGDGIWSSTDGVTWTLVPGSAAWTEVDEIQADPVVADRVWIAGENSSGGLKTYTPSAGFVNSSAVTGKYIDVKLSPDGTVIIAGRNSGGSSVISYVSTDSGNSFASVSGTGATQLPSSGRSRMEYAVSFDKNTGNKYTIYASASLGCLESVHVSEDHGVTWYEIAPEGSSNFDPFSNPGLGCQGSYDHMLGAVPGNPNQVLIGGTQAIYKWVKSATANPIFGQWYQKTFAYAFEFSPIYVHADQHEIKWDQNDILYIGSDGGISKSFDKGENVWISHNRGYNCTQFYSVAFNKFGHTMGGSQDNGTQYKDFTGVTSLEYREVMGGDGFDCDLSHINPNVMFATIYNGDFNRSDDEGSSWDFFAPLASSNYFNTVGRLYENPNDLDSEDSVMVIATNDYVAGDTLYFTSRTQQVELMHILTSNLNDGDTITLQDPVQSIFAAGYGASQGVYITRHSLRFNVTPVWQKVVPSVNGAVTCIEFSSNGKVMYVGSSGGSLYVVENLNTFYSPANDISGVTVTTINGFSSITGIGVDPQDEDHIVVTHTSSVSETNSATTATGTGSFTEITASLPAVTAYDAVIDYQDPNTIVIGTETGVYVTDNGGTSWQYQSQMGFVPVRAVRQQWRTSDCWNSGVVYIGTFGRGIWSTNSLVSTNDQDATAVAHMDVTEINTYPNPMNSNGTISFKLKERNNVDIHIMDLTGKIVLTKNLGEMNAGNVSAEINVTDLAAGTYVVMIKAGNETGTDKLVVTH
jgi:photosystem II stability/assembly factor-like uncharacterized protein